MTTPSLTIFATIGYQGPDIATCPSRNQRIDHGLASITEGWFFACVVGQNYDGNGFAREAIERCGCALVDRELPSPRRRSSDDVRSVLGELAALVYGRPSDVMKVIGVTGTNGKTTVSQMLAAVFNAGAEVSGDWNSEGDMTTPTPVLQRNCASLRRRSFAGHGVSSHSLVQHRVRGQHLRLQFSLTCMRSPRSLRHSRNISERNHCCYHGVAQMIVNDDDVHGRLLAIFPLGLRCIASQCRILRIFRWR